MSDRLYLATRKGLFTADRASGQWKITRCAFLADPVYIVLPDPRDGWVYAALGHGHFGVKLHRSSDGGETWEECKAPEYPKKPDDAEEIRCPSRNIPIPWNLELIWSLETGGSDNSGDLWCGTVPGGLFHSDDRGSTWEINRTMWEHPSRKEWFGGGLDYPGVHSICVDPRDPKHVTIGISCGGVWVTRDAGHSWDTATEGLWASYMPPDRKHDPVIQDAHCVAQCRGNPDVLWLQHHNGVFRSTDSGATWQELKNVPPSTFGFPVATHPTDPETAWFVPAESDERRVPIDGKVVVARTRDGGKSFDVLRNGLPQEHAYDITFRHALDVDDSGERLAFGSTTGSVWLSENQGDSWQCLSSNLPPVYCVRFDRHST